MGTALHSPPTYLEVGGVNTAMCQMGTALWGHFILSLRQKALVNEIADWITDLD